MMRQSNRSMALSLAFIVAGMMMLSFAAVPLYRMFCQITGFGGTTQSSIKLPDKVLDRSVEVSFNADVDPHLHWKFKPSQRSVNVRLGEMMLASYEAENLSDVAVTGMATYNVTPHEAGKYFHKVQCFCFDSQTLPAKTVVSMPISFYIDPEMDKDPQLNDVKFITLSYTFFPYDAD